MVIDCVDRGQHIESDDHGEEEENEEKRRRREGDYGNNDIDDGGGSNDGGVNSGDSETDATGICRGLLVSL